MALIIVIGHINLLWECDSIRFFFDRYIFPLVLPLFFLFSGFFFIPSKQDGSLVISWSDSARKIKRIVVLYLVWLIPNLPTVYLKLRVMDAAGVVSTILFSGVYMASWYLVALVWCMIVVTLLCHITKHYYLVFSIVLGLILILLSQGRIPDYLHIIDILTPYSIVRGLLYFSLGVLIKQIFIPKVVTVIGLFVSALLIVFCDFPYSLTAFIFVIFFFGDSLLSLFPSGSVVLGKFLRNTSTIIYLGHPVLSISLHHYFSCPPVVVFIIVFIVLTSFSYVVFRYEKKYPILSYFH